jgi:hypothetical protein
VATAARRAAAACAGGASKNFWRQYVRCSMTAFGYEQTEPATSLSVSLPPSAEVDQRRISPARESRHPATAFGPIPGAFQCATL